MSIFERPAKSILHPTDFSPTSELAFAHALAIAIANEAELTIMHVVRNEKEEIPWHDYPSVRKTLESWGKLQPGSHRSEVAEKLGIKVKKVVGVGKSVAKSIAGVAEVEFVDLIVMATGDDRQHPFWQKADVSLPVGKNTHLPMLFVPHNARGSVSMDDGSTSLNQVVIAVDHKPDAQPAIERVAWSIERFGGENSQVTLLHVGGEKSFPDIAPPRHGELSWSRVARHGKPANQIVAAAKEVDADAIVMITDWKKGVWDVLTGSTVEQVVKHSPCLVFTMPADDFE